MYLCACTPRGAFRSSAAAARRRRLGRPRRRARRRQRRPQPPVGDPRGGRGGGRGPLVPHPAAHGLPILAAPRPAPQAARERPHEAHGQGGALPGSQAAAPAAACNGKWLCAGCFQTLQEGMDRYREGIWTATGGGCTATGSPCALVLFIRGAAGRGAGAAAAARPPVVPDWGHGFWPALQSYTCLFSIQWPLLPRQACWAATHSLDTRRRPWLSCACAGRVAEGSGRFKRGRRRVSPRRARVHVRGRQQPPGSDC